MLTRASSYEDVYGGFRWQIPSSFNIGHAVCDRHAGNPTRPALIYEDAAGQIQEYAFLEIMRRANRLADTEQPFPAGGSGSRASSADPNLEPNRRS